MVLGDVGYPRGIEMDSLTEIVMRVEAYVSSMQRSGSPSSSHSSLHTP